MTFSDLWSHTGLIVRAVIVLGGLACLAGLAWSSVLAVRAFSRWHRGELPPLAPRLRPPEGSTCPVHELPATGACERCGAFVCASCPKTQWCGACLGRGEPLEPKGGAAALAPGILMAAVGMVGLLVSLLMCAVRVAGWFDGGGASSDGVLDLLFIVLPPMVSALLMTAGGVQMARKRTYGLAIAGGVVSLLPLAPLCWLASLIVGIWVLAVLSRADVREAFAAETGRK